MRSHKALPWRIGGADYLAGLRADVEQATLNGPPQPAPWDPELSRVMTAACRVIFEENMADALVRDLSGA